MDRGELTSLYVDFDCSLNIFFFYYLPQRFFKYFFRVTPKISIFSRFRQKVCPATPGRRNDTVVVLTNILGENEGPRVLTASTPFHSSTFNLLTIDFTPVNGRHTQY